MEAHVESILKEISENNRDAFKELFYRYYDSLYRHSDRVVKNNIISEEIVSEVFFTIWKNRTLLSEVHNIEAYLHTAVKNRAISFLRQVTAHHTQTISEEAIAISAIETDGPEWVMIHKELQSILQTAIEKLPVRCRTIFKLARISCWPYKKISEQLGISVRTIDAQLVIAQRKLQLALQPYLKE